MPHPFPLGEHLTSLKIIEYDAPILCRVFSVGLVDEDHGIDASDTDHPERSFLAELTCLKDAEVAARQKDTPCTLQIESHARMLWTFCTSANEDLHAMDKIAQDHSLTLVEGLKMTFSMRELLINEIASEQDFLIYMRGFFIRSLISAFNYALNRTPGIDMLGSQTIVCDRTYNAAMEMEGRELQQVAQTLANIHFRLRDGKIVLGLKRLKDTKIMSVKNLLRNGLAVQDFHGSDVWLGPSGRVARCLGIEESSNLDVSKNTPKREPVSSTALSQIDSVRQLMWKQSVKTWLQRQGVETSTDDEWVSLEVLMPQEAQSETSANVEKAGDLQILRNILWPSSQVFSKMYSNVKRTTYHESVGTKKLDALSEAQQWYRSSATRANNINKRKAAKIAEQLQHERLTAAEAVNRDDTAASSPTITRSYLDVQSAAAIYPTPPDGPLSHVTPGMSSIDGTGITPRDIADLSRPGPNGSVDQDTNMMDSNEGASSAYYNDDLFEDNPVDQSEAGEMVNEPDWDFFDEPDPDRDTSVAEEDKPADFSFSGSGIDSKTLQPQEDFIPMDHIEDGEPSEGRDTLPEQMTMKIEDPRAGENLDSAGGTPAQPQSPILSPNDIRRSLSPYKDKEATSNAGLLLDDTDRRRSSHFESMVPSEGIAPDDKYSKEGGRYWFNQDINRLASQKVSPGNDNFVNVGTMGRRRSQIASVAALGHLEQDDTSSGTSTPSSDSTQFHSSELLSDEGEPKDLWAGLKRKWAATAASSSASSFLIDEAERREIEAEHFLLLLNLLDDTCQYPMDRVFIDNNVSESLPLSLSGEALIQTAQTLADQVSQSFLLRDSKSGTELLDDNSRPDWEVLKALEPIFGRMNQPKISDLLEAADLQSDMDNSSMELIPSMVRLRRGDKHLEALPPILPFWETFGLQPVDGKRDVTVFCIHPETTSILNSCQAFLSRLGEAYESCNLGSHQLGPSNKVSDGGCIAWQYDLEESTPRLTTLCEDLGEEMFGQQVPSTVVLYVVSPTTAARQLAYICNSVLTGFKSFAKVPQDQQKTLPEIVLQIIPLSFIASGDTIVIPPPSDYLRLALEVYNRCPSKPSAESSPAESAPAVLLASQIPQLIAFDLSTSAGSPMQSDANSLHVAYSQSTDGRWIIAVWTDNHGKTFLTMSYCLRASDSPNSCTRPVPDIIKAIWETTVDIIASMHGRWSIIVCRDGPMDLTEVNTWIFGFNNRISVADTSSPDLSNLSLSLLTFDEDPVFSLTPPTPSIPASARKPNAAPQGAVHLQNTPTTANFQITANNQTPANYGTPTSTPTPSASQSILSPEQLMTAGTPGGMNAPTPSPSAPAMSQSLSQSQYLPPQSPAPLSAKPGTAQPQTSHVPAQTQSQSQAATSTAAPSQGDLQTILEADPTSTLSSSPSNYVGLLAPYPENNSLSLVDHRPALVSAYLLRLRSEAEAIEAGISAGAAGIGPETVMGVDLIWMSSTENTMAPTLKSQGGSSGLRNELKEVEDYGLVASPTRTQASTPATSMDTDEVGADMGNIGNNEEASDEAAAEQLQWHRQFLLEEILPVYRKLVTLAETRGMGYVSPIMENARMAEEDAEDSSIGRLGWEQRVGRRRKIKILPWHIMVAVRGRRVLEQAIL